jgi:hypothetical protein
MRLQKQETIVQVPSTVELEEVIAKSGCVSDFLDKVELGICSLARVMRQQYAKDEFMTYIGAKA